MKLSIIIPYYNAEPYTSELLNCLAPQLTDGVEVVVVDDGSKKPFKTEHEWVKVIRKKNGGVSSARNVGLRNTTGEYVAFIDADDLVADTYVEQILNSMPFDFLEMSWKSLPGGAQYSQKLNSQYDRLHNPSACTRVFKRDFIGKVRFNEKKDMAEDEDFTRHVDLERGHRAVITDYLYFYRTSVANSGSKKFLSGECKTKRIVYNIPHVTSDMTYLIKEMQKEDKLNEVYLLTNWNDIPELRHYCQIFPPHAVHGNELRGEPTKDFIQIVPPLKTQIIVYKTRLEAIGGIETFIYNFVRNMNEYYDITVVYEDGDVKQIARLIKHVRCKKNTGVMVCDTLILNSIFDVIPENIRYEKSIQVIHCCKLNPRWEIPKDRDLYVNVSEVSKNSFKNEGIVINNLSYSEQQSKTLLLVSAARFDSGVKGKNRMVQLANILNNNNIPFVWLYFSPVAIGNAPQNMIWMQPTLDIRPWMARADYVVQLSDEEAFCYTILEALEEGTPVITTPLKSLNEIGFVDGEHGFIVPFDMSAVFPEDILNTEFNFKFEYDNDKRVTQWRQILGDSIPLHDYQYEETRVTIAVEYMDMELNRKIPKGTVMDVSKERADVLRKRGLAI